MYEIAVKMGFVVMFAWMSERNWKKMEENNRNGLTKLEKYEKIMVNIERKWAKYFIHINKFSKMSDD